MSAACMWAIQKLGMIRGLEFKNAGLSKLRRAYAVRLDRRKRILSQLTSRGACPDGPTIEGTITLREKRKCESDVKDSYKFAERKKSSDIKRSAWQLVLATLTCS